jgi:ribosomal protein S18 acetylase RimI-like enzyme
MTRITVRPAIPSEANTALGLLFSETDNPAGRIEETLAAVKRREISLAGLLLAEVAKEPVGAGLFTEQPGRVGFVWPPGVPSGHPLRSTIQEAILADVSRRLDELNLCLGQVILDPHDGAARETLIRNGFPFLTDLHYMLSPANASPPCPQPSPFETETFDAEFNAERFARLVAMTYENTLDCPELSGLRTPEESLAAHQATGRFDPRRWQIFKHQQQDAGLLLINEHPERDLWEIVYLGVAPQARGKGLGEHMVQTAAAEAGRNSRSIVLAVDARNHLARKIYERCGFLDLTVQSVHLRQAAALAVPSKSTDYAQPPGAGKRIS